MSIPNPLAETRELESSGPRIGRFDTLEDSSARSPDELVAGLASLGERQVLGGRVGRYHVRESLGEGGMGTVVEAYDETLGRKVALKLLHERQAGQDELRLLREAQALARLSHPHVVQVYEVGEIEGRLFIAMELVDGVSLERWHARARPWHEVLDVYLQAGAGLAAAHQAGLVHRDFKPCNCVVDGSGRVRVLDFGLARDVGAADDPSRSRHGAPQESEDDVPVGLAIERAVTRAGSLMGTVAYMAPEQLLGLHADARSDQFAFCVSLYEALYRDSPFVRHAIRDLSQLVVEGTAPLPPAGSDVPKAIWRVLRRGLARDPAARWPSMDALLEQLRAVPTRRRRVRWGFAIALGVLGVVGLARDPSPAEVAKASAWAECGGLGVELPGFEPERTPTKDQLERTFVWATEHGRDALAVQVARELSETLAREHGEDEAAHAWQLTATALSLRSASRCLRP